LLRLIDENFKLKRKGFLLEQKLVNLLEPLEKNEQSMVKLDALFKILSIETENDVKLLAQYFVNHKQYKELIKNNNYTQNVQEKNQSSSISFRSDHLLDDSSEALENKKHVPAEKIELIDQNEAIAALKKFVSIHRKQEK
jgi:dynein regulatry complex protein 1